MFTSCSWCEPQLIPFFRLSVETLKVFRDTLAVLEKEAKEERNRLKTEHAQCITTNINKQKRDSLIAYLAAVEEKPHTVKKILKTARLFFQASEHDRLHR